MDAIGMTDDGDLGHAVMARLAHPINAVVPIMAVAYYVLWRHHLIASVPYWDIATTLLVAEAVSVLAFALWGTARSGWRLWALVGTDLAAIGSVIYVIGWGPVFASALVLGAADVMRRSGSSVATPAIVASLVVVGVGQTGIAVGLVPSLIRAPLAHGLAAMQCGAVVITVAFLGWFARARERAEALIRHRQRRFAALVTSSSDVILIVADDGAVRYASPQFARVFGYGDARRQNLVGPDLVHHDDVAAARDAIAAARAAEGEVVRREIRMKTSLGETRWFESALTDLTSDPDVDGFVVNLHDITGRKEVEDRLAHAAVHDPLTGLPNRTLIHDRAEQMLRRARRHHRPVAAMFVDLDNFKDVNDTLGHEVGDLLLKGVADRFVAVLRAGDTVGRLGGDEFVILAEGGSLAAGPELIAERLQEVLAEPFHIAGFEEIPLTVTASVGIATGDRPSADDLLRDADLALYRAKSRGKCRYAMFEPEMQSAAMERLELEMDLRGALERGEFALVYQPLFDLRAVTVTGVEALIRWNHPIRGTVLPDEFVPMLEETGMIVDVGRWVLREACSQAVAWRRQGHELLLSLNVSMRQLDADAFLDQVRQALADSGLPAESLVLEITETSLMHDTEATSRRLRMLKGIGVLVAIDDFGTGYSSLSYLRAFPIDALKIDRSFVAAMSDSPESVAMVESLVQLGRTLGLQTHAEGIEDDFQLRQLQRARCSHGQGFLFSRPLDPEGLLALLGAPGGADAADDLLGDTATR